MSHDLMIVVTALFGATTLMACAKLLRMDTMSWSLRIALWFLAGAVLVAVAHQVGGIVLGLSVIGMAEPSALSVALGAVGAVAIMLAVGLIWWLLRASGIAVGDKEGFDRVAAIPAARRLFLVTTAAFVEEVLYRGVPIGFGASVIGSPILAAVIATIAFVIAHFGWKLSHLAPVAVSGGGMAVLYLATGDLWACIVAHFIIDAMGFFVAPAMRTLRRSANSRNEDRRPE